MTYTGTASDPSTPPSSLTEAASHPWVLYATVLVLIIVLFAGAVPKVFGPLSTTFSDWAKRQRTAASEADDADIADLQRERDYLRGVADERLREIRARDTLIAEHLPWDYERLHAATRAGHSVPPPPPLFPPMPTDVATPDGHPT